MSRSDLSMQFARPEANGRKTAGQVGINRDLTALTLEILRQTTTASRKTESAVHWAKRSLEVSGLPWQSRSSPPKCRCL